MLNRTLHILSLIFGLVGLVGCLAVIVGTWSIHSRTIRISENAFRAIDDSLVVIQQRFAQMQTRVQTLNITTVEMRDSIEERTSSAVREHLGSGLGVEEQTERLASGLQQAGHWLELTTSTVQVVQRTLEAGNSVGVPVQTEPADHVLEELASVRAQLATAIEAVEQLRDRATKPGEGVSQVQQFNQIVSFATRVIATLGSVDSRLQECGDNLAEMQTKTRSAAAKVTRWIRLTSLGVTFLAVWMAAGQGSLCYLGWIGFRRR